MQHEDKKMVTNQNEIQEKAKKLLATVKTEELGKILSKLSDPNSRGWVMDEAEKRNSDGFCRWLDRDLCLDSDLSSFLLV